MSILLASGFAYGQGGVCVNFQGVPVRAKPHKKAKLIYEAPKHTPLTWSGKRERGYLEVTDFYGKRGWIWSRNVTYKPQCVLVRVQRSRLRKGPGKSFPKTPITAEQGQVFKDIGGEDGWTRIIDPKGNISWVNLDHVWRPSARLRMSFEY